MTDADEALEEPSAVSEELARSALGPRQQATVLELIDGICGDTWCEGDHNFRFDSLHCRAGCRGHAGQCVLTFRIFGHDTDVETGPTYTRSCRTGGFTGFDSLVETHDHYQSLTSSYYGALTECISEVEDALPR